MGSEIKKRIDEASVKTGGGGEAERAPEPAIFDLRYFSRNVKDFDGPGVITAMFQMSDDDGTFMAEDYRADSISEISEGISAYKMEWSGTTPEDEIALYESFRKTIEEVAGYVGPDRMIPMGDLPAPLAAFASMYLLPAEAWYTDEEAKAVDEDLDLIEDGVALDGRRRAELSLYKRAVEQDAQSRVGAGPLAHDLVRRCQRLMMLYSMEVPEILIRSEENKLAYTITVHYRGYNVLY